MKQHRIKGAMATGKLMGLIGIIIALLIQEYGHREQRRSQVRETPFSSIVITDGDTIKLPDGTIRIWGIDAPELHQICYKQEKEIPCGQEAKKAIQEILKSGQVICDKVADDRYKREVSRCTTANGDDIGQLMVSQGWALDYKQYSKGHYMQWQEDAQRNKRGIWALRFTKPWEWRKGTRRYK